MSSETIREALERARDHYRDHPDDARSTDSAATARLVDGLVVDVTGPSGSRVTTDMVPSVGGTATAPSPGWLLRAAEASCVVTLIAMRAAMLGISLRSVEVTVRPGLWRSVRWCCAIRGCRRARPRRHGESGAVQGSRRD